MAAITKERQRNIDRYWKVTEGIRNASLLEARSMMVRKHRRGEGGWTTGLGVWYVEEEWADDGTYLGDRSKYPGVKFSTAYGGGSQGLPEGEGDPGESDETVGVPGTVPRTVPKGGGTVGTVGTDTAGTDLEYDMRAAALLLQQQGKSVREISESIGVSKSRVHRYLTPKSS